MVIERILVDVDGVLTTGSFLYDKTGKVMKEFGPYDAAGAVRLKEMGIALYAITADERGFPITKKRLEDMNIPVGLLKDIQRIDFVKSFDRKSTLFIADGPDDVASLEYFDHSAAPSTAWHTARAAAKYQILSPAGYGVLLEACNLVDLIEQMHGNKKESPYVRIDDILNELKIFSKFMNNSESRYDSMVTLISDACRDDVPIIGIAAGRMGYALRGFIMRLAHIGARATFIGDTNLTRSDNSLVIVSSSSGDTPTVRMLAQKAYEYGAIVLLISHNESSAINHHHEFIYPHVSSFQVSKTIYEQFTWILFDKLAADIRKRLELPDDIVNQTHSILE